MTETMRKVLAVLGLVVVVLIGVGAWVLHGNPTDRPLAATTGRDPRLVDPEPEKFPTVGIAKPIGWQPGEAPVAAAGLQVNRFAEGLDHPRVMLTLPNGDVLVTETNRPAGQGPGGLTGLVMKLLFRRAGAGGPSPDAIVLLRDADGNGVAEQRFVLRQGQGLVSPSGLAWHDGTLFVANHDAVLAFAYKLGDTALAGTPRKLMDLPPAGNHWMRNLQLSPDATKLYVAVGSASNIAERGIKAEEGRAAIWEIDLASGRPRPYAGGLRNPNGMDWNPASGELWTTVNERDMLGGDLVPDYLTNVPIGAQYGWPWFYWKDKQDDRVKEPMPPYLNEYVRKPEFALGAHVAALGLRFAAAGNRLGANFGNGAFIARHGSWNRKPASGYDVVFVTFDANGNPRGQPVPVLGGFLTRDGETHGRPTWLAFDRTGALLVTDDTAGIVWRLIDPRAAPAPGVKPVVTGHMPPQRQLNSEAAATFRAAEEEAAAADK
ncbi:PQQ-dependent sugar dehydrogenase [Novosphingobium aerophilum]|uniref:Sorbosone dehydrogenase family protein n=1 Tax=Novosphingobium aerophilum TaxID=2839843 RepID=A0A7X1KCN5_9SPHN|nr:sorbosone dehydrogenase family protein [Novosphingobium aerophilum]MBC2652473.1 sorbosone dehydrogenase family protein [Novosphingobium aerophilum]